VSKETIAILGGGSWGATLAAHLANRGHNVAVWEFVSDVAKRLRETRSLPTIPQLRLPSSVLVTNDMKEALDGRPVVLSVTPSHTVRSTFKAAAPHLKSGALIISATKGIENETFMRMSEVIREMFPAAGDIVILSGPSHAEEVAVGQPVVMVAACEARTAAAHVRDMFASETFRIYTSGDPAGVEFGGALKNIYAVACGVVDGLKLGDNTKAALMTRSLLEMTRLGATAGARPVTFFGLSGLGDLIVTCGSRHSRNRLVGEKIGSGKKLDQALKEMTMVAEGVNTARSAWKFAESRHVDVPIIHEMYQVLFENKAPKDSIRDLMTRQVGAEMEGVVL
jgi:glycerol-3-phosphate dehydrogenase (NAD(P)+)